MNVTPPEPPKMELVKEDYSLELLQSKTNDFINKLENSKGLHFMALMLTT